MTDKKFTTLSPAWNPLTTETMYAVRCRRFMVAGAILLGLSMLMDGPAYVFFPLFIGAFLCIVTSTVNGFLHRRTQRDRFRLPEERLPRK